MRLRGPDEIEEVVWECYCENEPGVLLDLHRRNPSPAALLAWLEKRAPPIQAMAQALSDIYAPEAEDLDPGAVAEALADGLPQPDIDFDPPELPPDDRRKLEDWMERLLGSH